MRISDWSSDVCSSDLRAPPSRPAASAIAARRMPSSSICECPRHVREVERMLDHSPVSAIGHNVSPAFWDELQETIGMSERNYLVALAIDDERRRRDLADIVLVPGQQIGRASGRERGSKEV